MPVLGIKENELSFLIMYKKGITGCFDQHRHVHRIDKCQI